MPKWESYSGRNEGDTLPLPKCKQCRFYEYDKSNPVSPHQCWVETHDTDVASYALVKKQMPNDCSRFEKGERETAKTKRRGGSGGIWEKVFFCLCRILYFLPNWMFGWRCYTNGKRF